MSDDTAGAGVIFSDEIEFRGVYANDYDPDRKFLTTQEIQCHAIYIADVERIVNRGNILDFDDEETLLRVGYQYGDNVEIRFNRPQDLLRFARELSDFAGRAIMTQAAKDAAKPKDWTG